MISHEAAQHAPGYPYDQGRLLVCNTCGAEVEIKKPSACLPPLLTVTCCGRPMTPVIPRI